MLDPIDATRPPLMTFERFAEILRAAGYKDESFISHVWEKKPAQIQPRDTPVDAIKVIKVAAMTEAGLAEALKRGIGQI